ncbi:endoplasmic reticulum oxidoreductin-1-like isoform X2 [Aristolochia californica]|uniref:endoplasmic reticulum oxidoreductin-1-like isoform X2 n=1 Tax=Aristolochia californica TaxID=171875 RepID=UPI0035D7BB17
MTNQVKQKPPRTRWGWATIGALMVVCLATAVATSTNTPKFLLFGRTSKPCDCTFSKKYTEIVVDCRCEYKTVDSLDKEVLHPILQELVTTTFFRYFKVKLWCDCKFWPDDGMCNLRDCSVCECPESEFPEPFKKPFHGLPVDDLMCQEGKPQAAVDRTIDTKVFKGWVEIDNPWTHEDETDNADLTYVNLLLNPERYTGYSGPSARRIWKAIYSEKCPKVGLELLGNTSSLEVY